MYFSFTPSEDEKEESRGGAATATTQEDKSRISAEGEKVAGASCAAQKLQPDQQPRPDGPRYKVIVGRMLQRSDPRHRALGRVGAETQFAVGRSPARVPRMAGQPRATLYSPRCSLDAVTVRRAE